MLCFHRTDAAAAILNRGFLDGEGYYLTTELHRGVWLSDRPLDIQEGAKGRDLLAIEVPDEVLAEFEWIEEGKPYREFLVPAVVANEYGPPSLVDEDDYMPSEGVNNEN